MATQAPSNVGPDTLITVKIYYNDSARRFKIPLRDLGARVLPHKLRQLLGVPADSNVIFERFSDSAGRYVRLDSENLAVYKQLYRAAKAKSKLRIKAINATDPPSPALKQEDSTEQPGPAKSVLSSPLPDAQTQVSSSNGTVLASDFRNGVDGAAPVDQPKQWLGVGVDSNQPTYHSFLPDLGNGGLPIPHKPLSGAFFIDCNNCGRSVVNEHYHCSICESGDYDLCPSCVDSGVTCQGDEHWLIKRFVRDGIVINGTTETVASRKPEVKESVKKPADPVSEPTGEGAPEPASVSPTKADERICNACLNEFDETDVVSCSTCEDFDLCMTCLLKGRHGHHPAHAFAPLRDREFCLKNLVLSRCSPGRHHQHAAICDGCEKRIIGIRHKCLACPDWDYCSGCFANAASTHPSHRFVPVYEAMAERPQHHEIHYGIFCDGPLCKNRPFPSYLTGVRYKCAVCDDTDFCAKCEALPTNTHNRTHPLVMFKTPIRSVNISMINEDENGGYVAAPGDRSQRSTSTQAGVPIDRGDTTDASQPEKTEKIIPEKVESCREGEKAEMPASDSSGYEAFFLRDTVPDGTVIAPNKVFQQTWTLYNPGPLAWPAFSDVRFVGGDSMFDVDTGCASSIDSITSAMGSNKLSAPVEPGQSVDFSVTLKAPNREGKAISYWRLKLANGMPFGHRLWCEVEVRDESEKASNGKQLGDTKEADGTRSGMIFPMLDKESPVTSTHEAMVEPAAPAVSNQSENDVLEDVESLTLGEDDTEAGFVTDEEYDVLDASDQEFQDAKQAQK